MGIDYNAVVYYGIIKNYKEFDEDFYDENGLHECMEEFISDINDLTYIVLGYEGNEEVIIGKRISDSAGYEYDKFKMITKKEMKDIDEILGEKGSLFTIQNIW